MSPPLSARLIRSLLVTFSVAQFCRMFAGAAPPLALALMTFAWAGTIASQMNDADRARIRGAEPWSSDAAIGFLSGQVLWAAPLLQVIRPDHWFWLPVPIPTTLTTFALLATVCCPLLPFWNRVIVQPRAVEVSRDFDLPILLTSFFVLSGSFVFAIGAAVSLTTMCASRLGVSRPAAYDRKMSHTMSYVVLKTT